MKKILVIGTGGTITSLKTKDGLKPMYKTCKLISLFPEIKQIADAEGITLFNMDSTNMQPHHWSEMAKEIGRRYDKYAGFVVIHGTDTMQYSAAALSFMLQNLGKPVVLTGSVKPAMAEKSDAKQNFLDSIVVACSDINEVCIVFHGKIIRGCRARKIMNEATRIVNETLDVYSSINCPIIGQVGGKSDKRKIQVDRRYRQISRKGKLKVSSKIDSDSVSLIKIFPGFSPRALDGLAKRVVLEAYGPGNVPFMENSLVEEIWQLTKKGTLVFITTQNPFGEADMTLYEVGRKALDAGAISCRDMTSEAALVKLMWISGNFGNDSKTVKKLMLKDFVGEIRD